MKRALLLTGLLLLPFASAHAAPAPPPAASADAPVSEASLRELMELTQARKLIDNVYGQIDTSFDAGLKASLGDKKVTPSQQKVVDDVRSKVNSLMREALSWDRLEPMFLDIYGMTFSQQEIDGMLTFYRSDAGRAVIAKMPLVMEASMKSTLTLLSDMTPKMRKIMNEAREAIEADAEQQKKAVAP